MPLLVTKKISVAVSNCLKLYSYVSCFRFLLIYLVLAQNLRKSTLWKVFVGVPRSGVELGSFVVAHRNTECGYMEIKYSQNKWQCNWC